MKKSHLIATLFATLALVIGLVACAAPIDRSKFIGVWEIDSMTTEDQALDSDSLALMKGFGLNVYLELEDNGKAHLSMFDNQLGEGTWEATSNTEAKLIVKDGDTTTETVVRLENDKLTMKQDGASMSLKKTTKEAMEQYTKDHGGLEDALSNGLGLLGEGLSDLTDSLGNSLSSIGDETEGQPSSPDSPSSPETSAVPTTPATAA